MINIRWLKKVVVLLANLLLASGSLGSSFIFLGVHVDELLLLVGNALLTALAGLADLLSSGFSLIGQHFAALLLSLLLVNVFHKDTLVLENITLALHVQVMVQVAIDFLAVTVLLQQTSEDTLTLHPQEFGGHTGIGSTLALTKATVTTLATSFRIFADTIAGVHYDGFFDDQTILNQFADVLA